MVAREVPIKRLTELLIPYLKHPFIEYYVNNFTVVEKTSNHSAKSKNIKKKKKRNEDEDAESITSISTKRSRSKAEEASCTAIIHNDSALQFIFTEIGAIGFFIRPFRINFDIVTNPTDQLSYECFK